MDELSEQKGNETVEELQTQAEGAASAVSSDIESNDSYDLEEKKPVNKIQAYFQHGNRLLTLPSNPNLVINDDTRRLVALFSDGRFLVSETHKFDGRVLSFEVLARKKKLSISKPEYVILRAMKTLTNCKCKKTL